MKETQTDLVFRYASCDTLNVYEIERIVCEQWKTFEAVGVNDEDGRWILVSAETCKVGVERYDIEADDFAAFPVLGSLDYPSAVPATYIEYSLERTLWFVPGLGK